ncbi:MAG: glycoside hydrolase family 99-like domain-containing protein [Candidatus Cryptobacteroides sp.]
MNKTVPGADANARVIAFYLPQFHPIPENDEWWGEGFTEWTNVGKAKPLYPGHYQPRVPADLGYCDLRVPETRVAQADMAREYGIEGFLYWHYWFGNGKMLLERPFQEVLESGSPDFPFCLGWANESWAGFWHGVKGRNVLIEQKYPGKEDYIAHFRKVLPAFLDKRYIKVDGKPLFMIYRPLNNVDEVLSMMSIWRELALQNGLEGIWFVSQTYDVDNEFDRLMAMGFDSVNVVRQYDFEKKRPLLKFFAKLRSKLFRCPTVVRYDRAARWFVDRDFDRREDVIPTIIPNWDHSPRTGRRAFVLHNSTPEYFSEHLKDVAGVLEGKEHKIVFVKSWNEWAEGNYLEPDLKFGKRYLEALRAVFKK